MLAGRSGEGATCITIIAVAAMPDLRLCYCGRVAGRADSTALIWPNKSHAKRHGQGRQGTHSPITPSEACNSGRSPDLSSDNHFAGVGREYQEKITRATGRGLIKFRGGATKLRFGPVKFRGEAATKFRARLGFSIRICLRIHPVAHDIRPYLPVSQARIGFRPCG
jgi:hypothetical protein